MTRICLAFFGALMLVFASFTPAFAAGKYDGCTTIQDGVLQDSQGEDLTAGYNSWWYNYQARRFQGDYCDAYYGAAWCQAYVGIDLIMEWNAAWLDNKDCDGDTLLDRHCGLPNYLDSGAWLTNHMSGENLDGTHWTYFIKIIAAQSDWDAVAGIWYDESGNEVGPVIWGEFAVIQEIVNDPSTGDHGVFYLSPVGPGLGK